MATDINHSTFLERIQLNFGHNPNKEQEMLMSCLVDFTLSDEFPACFILKGYAGTGKTSILGAYIQSMKQFTKKTVLMAPTGRAAKVLSLKSKFTASTIHKRIYFTGTTPDGSVKLQLAPNKSKNTVFIIDEASMLGELSAQQDGTISRDLLEDVLQYVYNGENCKLILLGDEGQLPPVGSELSPALNLAYLEHHFPRVNFYVYGLSEVIRQKADSGILENATRIRKAQKTNILPQIDLERFSDVKAVQGDELIEKIDSAYANYGTDEVIVVTRSNKRANLYNQHIRNRILMMEEELCGGDMLMVVKNNYFWLDPLCSAGFIANGEIVKVHRVKKTETLYNVRFAHLEISLVDYPDLDRFEAIAFLDSLTSEQANLDRTFLKTLFFEIEKDYLHEKNKQKRYKEIMKSPYFNALQVKFAYAITCHKSQGGQWEVVFVDHGYLEEEQINNSFLRWLYTAFTRAAKQLYTVNLLEKIVQKK